MIPPAVLAALDAPGEVWECGVYKGRSALVWAQELAWRQPKPLRLFDTFQGHPGYGPQDTGTGGSRFTDTSLDVVRARLGPYGFVSYHVGEIPTTFLGLDASTIAVAYVDLDLYAGTRDALAYILPRLSPGGIVLVDDYEAAAVWPGVKRAVDLMVGDPWTLTVDAGQAVIRWA